ncbi:uncharacterized protein MONBRDRAFT_14978 [Monosiga brevicollis MX1]|uniref:Sugar phosphate transporter domain-containing protein n=1 Tax=Monosiga brevicollis TaxID=81824 RepID=A9UTL5_MONBE|nr:uncharacterized protein MONBRDRAFT_14978 [Monosiga brevicollis MX1]EDQ91266.1 predicted protein [Monosiga brevicollis MX1]|eukprot:XP_001743688.1 hypothetical protein [Monosiga brevicollis MX1]
MSGVFETIDVGPAAILWLSAWYLCSLVTLFMNKIILSHEEGDKYILGITQMIMTATLGAIKVYGPGLWRRAVGGRTRPYEPLGSDKQYTSFWRDMILVGIMRGATVICGLVSLSHVAVSFTETIKSSAPFFTVIFAKVILGQHTSWQVNLSLLPVMIGLALCSFSELSFDTIGFLAAILNNIIDCVQNVFSKKLLQHLSPVDLQFYTSAAAALIQLPGFFYVLWPQLNGSVTISSKLWMMILIDAVFYHLQSVTAYFTMHHLMPVSQSVANTVKRAMLIWLSILYFGNPITVASAIGMATVILGVFAYNHCRLRYPATLGAVAVRRSVRV